MKDEKIKSAFKNNFYPILPVLPRCCLPRRSNYWNSLDFMGLLLTQV